MNERDFKAGLWIGWCIGVGFMLPIAVGLAAGLMRSSPRSRGTVVSSQTEFGPEFIEYNGCRWIAEADHVAALRQARNDSYEEGLRYSRPFYEQGQRDALALAVAYL